MSIEENKAIMRRVWGEVFDEGKSEKVDELFTNDHLYHIPGGREIKGIEHFKKFNDWVHNDFSELHFTVGNLMADGDNVVTHYTMTGTHKNNKKLVLRGVVIARIAAGKVAEQWEIFDCLEMASQLAPGWAKALLKLVHKQMSKGLP